MFIVNKTGLKLEQLVAHYFCQSAQPAQAGFARERFVKRQHGRLVGCGRARAVSEWCVWVERGWSLFFHFLLLHSSLAGVLHHSLTCQPTSLGRQAHTHTPPTHTHHSLTARAPAPHQSATLSFYKTLPRKSCTGWLGTQGSKRGPPAAVICG